MFREALALLAAYGDAPAATGPALSEIHVDPRNGFSLFLLDGGGEIRLGRGATSTRSWRASTQILSALGPRGPPALATVYLDGPSRPRDGPPGGRGPGSCRAP